MRNLSILVLALTISACGSDKKDEGAGRAEGQILPASVSDAMIPLDTVRSQAPLAPKASGSAKDDKRADATATDAAASPSAEAAAPPPEASPTPAG